MAWGPRGQCDIGVGGAAPTPGLGDPLQLSSSLGLPTCQVGLMELPAPCRAVRRPCLQEGSAASVFLPGQGEPARVGEGTA